MMFFATISDIFYSRFSVDKESFDLSAKTTELRAKLQQAREQIEKLPGIDNNPEDQKKHIEVNSFYLQMPVIELLFIFHVCIVLKYMYTCDLQLENVCL